MQRLLDLLNRIESVSARQREKLRAQRKRALSPFGVGYANFHERMIAATLDLLIVSFVTALLLPPVTNAQAWVMNSIWQTLALVLYCLGCWFLCASTPGKMVFRIHIVDAKTGEPMGRAQAIRRLFAYLPSAISVFGIFAMTWRSDRRMWHDVLAGTAVVKKCATKKAAG
jgi:uncharacterized RDD family membrane protein YckC